jgi:hypothetical protein
MLRSVMERDLPKRQTATIVLGTPRTFGHDKKNLLVVAKS